MRAEDPGKAFAPLVELDPAERWRPMGAGWFIDRAVLGWAEDQGCPDRRVAVGRALRAQRTPTTDWIYVFGLAGEFAYRRAPHDASCEDRERLELGADDPTRPFGPRARPTGLRPPEGFYLDLVDRARAGPPLSGSTTGVRAVASGVPAYVERAPVTVAGERGLRLTYWMLYGMDDPGPAAARPTREGDWERIDVLVRVGDGDGEYVPVAVRAGGRETAWADVRVEPGTSVDEAAHPVVRAAAGIHRARAARADDCAACPLWRTWRALLSLRSRRWYGFGGAWGEVGLDDATTGPLGPHGPWPPRP